MTHVHPLLAEGGGMLACRAVAVELIKDKPTYICKLNHFDSKEPMDSDIRPNIDRLLHEREAANALLQAELEELGKVDLGSHSLAKNLAGVTPEDLEDIASAANVDELEIALLALEERCSLRRLEQNNRTTSTWRSMQSKYNIEVCWL